MVDRVETTSTVWLGVTLGCARCHNHKYDPFTQKEFYQVFAYFNNVPERGKAFKYGNSPPVIPAPTAEQQAVLAALDRDRDRRPDESPNWSPRSQRPSAPGNNSSAGNRRWTGQGPRDIAVDLPLAGDLRGDIVPDPPRSEKYTYLMENGPVVDQPPAPAKIDPVWKDGEAEYAAGRAARQARSMASAMWKWATSPISDSTIHSRCRRGSIRPRPAAPSSRARRMRRKARASGLNLRNGHLQANMVQRWLDDGARVESEATVPLNRWSHVILTYDGSRVASSVLVYLNGQPLKMKIQLDDLNQIFAAKQPLRIGAGFGPANRFHGSIQRCGFIARR